ncbi:glycosyltransferase family 4 protein [Desulfopila inferna]|uniref:glycosyltransferase family 4 protein n=1 Tax=Desulfopila inferna TaxID=468528 RepID=UPI0019628FF6|nr:glycosyltransferase family 4 protein [Desulfopila inferna]MBM9603624.1 glycosyltransferase family 4 protein [Desulfopila inferna]
MKIAQVAPLFESVPPRLYGGTERVVSYITEELINQGHEVTLFASGDSVTRAQLRPVCDSSLRLHKSPCDHLAYHILLVQKIFNEAHLYDIIHFHIDYIHYPLARLTRTPQITTLHGRQDLPDLQHIYREFFEMPVISISNSQRTPLPNANWQATVYHGIPGHFFTLHKDHHGYLAFLGRTSPEKGLEEAIRIAVLADTELHIAAKVDAKDEAYFDEVIKPLLKNTQIHFLGEINEQEKNDFLGNARALLFPIQWPEPFGMVMIEAMACGTPVVAFRRGSVPEVIENGVTGFIVDDIREAVQAVQNIDAISRPKCHSAFKKRFSSTRMVEEYVKIYQKLLGTTDRINETQWNGEVNYGRRYSDRRQMVYSGNILKG